MKREWIGGSGVKFSLIGCLMVILFWVISNLVLGGLYFLFL